MISFFKQGDRVGVFAPGHPLHGKTGRVIDVICSNRDNTPTHIHIFMDQGQEKLITVEAEKVAKVTSL